MVGEGVLFGCIEHPDVEQILLVNRRHYEISHPKVKEIIVKDFFHLDEATDRLKGFDACFYCAGISSVGMSEADYTRVTYDTTISFAKKVLSLNPEMTFIFVSGAQTDTTGKSKMMWARVKGRTENALMEMPFKNVYNFRPGLMKPFPGQKNIKSVIKIILGLYPVLKLIFPGRTSIMPDVARAMINAVLKGYPKHILEIKDINTLGSNS
jgi:hypothetical protein